MAEFIAMFSRWTKSGLWTLLDLPGRSKRSSSLDGSSSASLSVEATLCSALDDFQRIIRMLPRIEAVLRDAEEREIQEKSLNLWLSELRFLAYDIDDVIDEYEYDTLVAQMEARAAAKEPYHLGKRKRGYDDHHYEVEKREGRNILKSSSSQVPAISDDIVEKIREIRERFEEIGRDRNVLHLGNVDGVRRTISAEYLRLTSSLVNESSIIGRKSEKEEIVKLLLSDFESDSNIPVSNKFVVIPIIGMGGVGKTALAKLIYNDPRIVEYFDLRKWIYVSENFDLVKLTKQIYTSITNSRVRFGFASLQESIKEELMKFKRIFLVFDDVWNEKQCLWESLQVPFHGAGIVNILLTTRNIKVANVMRTTNIFDLGVLSEDEGLQLFNKCASCDDKNLMEIGKSIVKRCNGLPLAIKLFGSHLKFETRKDEWMKILESDLWDLDPMSSEIFHPLRLSYERMPSHLKPCFRYCSIFPKDKMPDKNHLVWLWMAQDYIQPKIRGKTMEEIGREYFDELLERSLFQATENTDCVMMHDLVYELAVFISRNEFITMKSEGGSQNKCLSNNNVRHLAIHDRSTNNEALKVLMRQVPLRSIFHYSKIFNDFHLSNSKRLRAVHIDSIVSYSQLSKILGSIASLKHLRYIYIRKWNSRLSQNDMNDAPSTLLSSLHSIHNVQVLDLSGYGRPIMLPTSIKNLINLRHLLLPDGSIMPCGISELTGLQTLKFAIVRDGNQEDGGNLIYISIPLQQGN